MSDEKTKNATRRPRRRRRRRGSRNGGEEAVSRGVPPRLADQLQVEHVPTESLRPFDANPRMMTEAERAKLRRSIERFGFVDPLIVRRPDRLVIGGHQRLEVAKEMGLPRVPVVFVEVTEAEARALNLALNRIVGEFDLPQLGALLQELRDLPDFDETLSGFDPREIEEVLAEVEREARPDPYEESFELAAEFLQQQRRSAPTRVRPGQLWQLGRHRLLCGDSLAPGQLTRALGGEQADLVLTDPPYGVSYRSTLARRGRRKDPIANDEAESFEDFLARAIPAVKATMKPGAVLHWFAGAGGPEPVLAKSLLAIAEHLSLLNLLVWDKLDPGLGWRWRRSWEAVIEAANGRPRVWNGGTDLRNVLRFPKAIPGAEEHPTPKPVPLLETLMKACSPTDGLVLDPFAGSGSTLIAAERTGRTCACVELEPRYADITLARWQSFTGQEPRPLEQGS